MNTKLSYIFLCIAILLLNINGCARIPESEASLSDTAAEVGESKSDPIYNEKSELAPGSETIAESRDPGEATRPLPEPKPAPSEVIQGKAESSDPGEATRPLSKPKPAEPEPSEVIHVEVDNEPSALVEVNSTGEKKLLHLDKAVPGEDVRAEWREKTTALPEELSMSDENKIPPTWLFISGGVLLFIVLFLVFKFDKPNDMQKLVLRTTLALAAACLTAGIPGFITLDSDVLHAGAFQAGGALAVFLLVYWFDPGSKLSRPKNDEDS